MLDSDVQNEWMAALDWSAHGPARDGNVSRHLFLAEAVELLARNVCGPWPLIPHFLAHAGNPTTLETVDEGDAFEGDGSSEDDGRPIQDVHERLGGTMRRLAERHGVAIASDDAMTRSEWATIHHEAAWTWSVGVGARRAVAGVAPLFARMAFDRRITVLARPVGGGTQYVDAGGPEWWEIGGGQAVRRLAACGLALDDPYAEEAPATHHLFVSHDGYQAALIETARRSYVNTINVDVRVRREVDYYAVQTSEVAKFLVALMVPANASMTNDDFMRAVEAEFGSRGLGRVFTKAKALAVAHEGCERFGKPGHRPGRPREPKDLPVPERRPTGDGTTLRSIA